MKRIAPFVFALFFLLSCKERYNPPITSPPAGYLVVEGFINNGLEPTTITLSRTTPLYDSSGAVTYESGAQVSVESNNSESYQLFENSPGVYTSQASLPLNNTEQYRLHIVTTNGKEYASDYTSVKTTPPIDSISWQRDNDGVHLFVNAHDETGNTKYYQWYYEETWEFHSAYYSSLKYFIQQLPDASQNYSVVYRFPDQSYDTTIYKCWKSPHSTSILLGSTTKLSTATIYQNLINIPAAAQQLSILYSVKLYQHAVSKDDYDFLRKMKKNTESLGSIFDAQPSELKGNIHCITTPNEQVVGFMEVSQLQTQRIFISNKQVPNWGYKPPCYEVKLANSSDAIKANGLSLLPTDPASTNPLTEQVITFFAAPPECVDCTLTGSNVKPPFWP